MLIMVLSAVIAQKFSHGDVFKKSNDLAFYHTVILFSR